MVEERSGANGSGKGRRHKQARVRDGSAQVTFLSMYFLRSGPPLPDMLEEDSGSFGQLEPPNLSSRSVSLVTSTTKIRIAEGGSPALLSRIAARAS